VAEGNGPGHRKKNGTKNGPAFSIKNLFSKDVRQPDSEFQHDKYFSTLDRETSAATKRGSDPREPGNSPSSSINSEEQRLTTPAKHAGAEGERLIA